MSGPTSRTTPAQVNDRAVGRGWAPDAGFGPPWGDRGPWGPGRPPQVFLAVVLAIVQLVGTVVVGAATATYLVLGYAYGPVVLSLVVVLVAAVLTGHRLVAWLVAGGVLVAHGVATALDPDRGWSWGAATATLAWALLVLTLAEVGRVRRER